MRLKILLLRNRTYLFLNSSSLFKCWRPIINNLLAVYSFTSFSDILNTIYKAGIFHDTLFFSTFINQSKINLLLVYFS